MAFTTEQISREHAELLISILSAAEEVEERIRDALHDPHCIAYAGWLDNQIVGAAVVRWEEDTSGEILYIAIRANLRGQGYGKQIIQHLQEELRERRGLALLVGTANAAFDNIAFYQKCGFRMYEIRRDYFDYIQPPVIENGIQIRDMLVFRYDPA